MGSYQAQLFGWKTIGDKNGRGNYSVIFAISAFGRQLRFTYVREPVGDPKEGMRRLEELGIARSGCCGARITRNTVDFRPTCTQCGRKLDGTQ